jgi:GNAT superfamily N-acetyltransferase
MAVVPEHRRKGVGRLLMDWGVKKADELGVEAWMEASSLGRLLYENVGFKVLLKLVWDTHKIDADDDWRRMEHELTPPPFCVMWRPSSKEKETTKMPWELGKIDSLESHVTS